MSVASFEDRTSAHAGLDDMAAQLARVSHSPSFALMMAFPHSLGLPFAACELQGHPELRFLSCDSSKPVRSLVALPLACFWTTSGTAGSGFVCRDAPEPKLQLLHKQLKQVLCVR
jgi:predicted NAD/FAD-dependent oxidoreductase